MKKFLLVAPAAFALLTVLPAAGPHGIALAAEEAPTVEDLADARRCAAETRVAGHAFVEVRDSVRAGGTTRAASLLSVAEDALVDARSACRGNAEVSAQLELLAGEAERLRSSLGSTR